MSTMSHELKAPRAVQVLIDQPAMIEMWSITPA
jgi:hypothetical protein